MDVLKPTHARLIDGKKALWIARILVATMFAESVITHMLNYDMVLTDAAKAGIPFTQITFPLSLAAELFGTIALLTGWQYRLGVLVLIGFTFLSSVFFFPFWSAECAEAAIFRQQFFKNMALIGCLLFMHSIGKHISKSE